MKIKAAKSNAGMQQSQGVNPGKEAAQGSGGSTSDLKQEFQGLLATFAGGVNLKTNLPLDTFQVDALKPQAAVTPDHAPTSVQTALQASALAAAQADTSAPEAETSTEQETSEGNTSPDETLLDSTVLPDEVQTATMASAHAACTTKKVEGTSQSAAPTSSDLSSTVETPVAPETATDVSGDNNAEQSPVQTQVDEATLETTQTGDWQDAPTSQEPQGATSNIRQGAEHDSKVRSSQAAQETKSSAEIAASSTPEAALSTAPAVAKESTGSNLKEQIQQALTKILETFEPIETAPRNQAQSNPAIPVLSNILKHSSVLEMAATSITQNDAHSQSAIADRTMQPIQTQNNALAGIGGASATRGSDLNEARTSRPLTSAVATRTLERVEQTLKEVARSKDGKSISLVLTPSELGAVKVDVTLKDGSLHARLGAENAQVAQLLREKAPELQAMLRKLGLEVDRVTVSVHSEHQSFSQMQDQLEKRTSQQKQAGVGNHFGTFINGHEQATVVVPQKQTLDHWVA